MYLYYTRRAVFLQGVTGLYPPFFPSFGRTPRNVPPFCLGRGFSGEILTKFKLFGILKTAEEKGSSRTASFRRIPQSRETGCAASFSELIYSQKVYNKIRFFSVTNPLSFRLYGQSMCSEIQTSALAARGDGTETENEKNDLGNCTDLHDPDCPFRVQKAGHGIAEWSGTDRRRPGNADGDLRTDAPRPAGGI
jgi:hypothetical protein